MTVWHYTTGQKFALIMKSGQLQPSAIGVKPPERPVLWFSAEPYWEPTANKAVLTPTGGIQTLTMRQTAQLCQGLYRFGVDAESLAQGGALRKVSRMNLRVWQGLCAEGLKQGANPLHWFGAVEPIALSAVTCFQKMNEAFAWEDVTA